MSELFKGVVLEGVKSADSNASTTNEAEIKVVRDFKPKADLFSGFSASFLSVLPDFVDLRAEIYRSAVLSEESSEEYFVWAANSSNLALDPSKLLKNAEVIFRPLNLTIREGLGDPYYDATNVFYVHDLQGQKISAVLHLYAVINGDTAHFTSDHFDYNPQSGKVTLKNTLETRNLTESGANQAALSEGRGDKITYAWYEVEDARFWWTKNEPTQNRFKWDGAKRNWDLIRGSKPVNLGQLVSESFTLSPLPTWIKQGEFLDGEASDEYATLRLGDSPNEASVPVSSNKDFSGVLAVSQAQLENEEIAFDDYNPPLSGLVSIESGEILFNPALVEAYYGSTLWYSTLDLNEENDGVVGTFGEDLYISPPPPPQSRPMLHIGNRRPLSVTLVDTEALLDGLSLQEGHVGVALSTGKLKFSDDDLLKIDINSIYFSTLYVGAQVIYRGIALNKEPLPVKHPAPMRNESGVEITNLAKNTKLRIPPSVLAEDGYLTSGYLGEPDKTGTKPNDSSQPNFRPNGSGLVTSAQGVGDFFIYTEGACLERVKVVDRVSDLPKRKEIKESAAYVALEADAVGLPTHAPSTWQKDNKGGRLLFRQSELIPSRYVGGGELVSKKRAIFEIREGDSLHFHKDGVYTRWTYVGGDIAQSMSSVLGGGVSVYLINRHLVIRVETGTTLELSPYDNSGNKDTAALEALGLPAFYHSDHAWSIDSGVALGVYRSPVNLDLSRDITDFKSTSIINDQPIGTISTSPFSFLDFNPLEDGLGYTRTAFFKYDSGIRQKILYPFEDVAYNFEDKQIKWVERVAKTIPIQRPTVNISLEDTQILEGSTTPERGGFVKYSDGANDYEYLTLDKDYVVSAPQGQITLIESYNSSLSTGLVSVRALGWVESADANFFNGVVEGQILKIVLSSGVRYVKVKANQTTYVETNLRVDESNVFCTILEHDSARDSVFAEVFYEPFNHLNEKPLVVRKLTPLPEDRIIAPFESITLGRETAIRIDDVDQTPYILNKGVALGDISANLTMPSLNADKENNSDLFLTISGQEFSSPLGNLNRVEAFTDDETIIEYLPTGVIRVGLEITTSLADSVVYYSESFSSDSLELDPHTGEVNTQATSAYFVEVLIEGVDYTPNALAGSFQLSKPLVAGQEIEVTYQPGDVDGRPTSEDRVTKKLPFFIKSEEAQRNSQYNYDFNPNGLTLDTSFEPVVYVEANLENYRGAQTVTIGDNRLDFNRAIADGRPVSVTYAVFTAQGGELMFTLGEPYYHEPFFLEVEQRLFKLKGDRSEVSTGKLLRLGASTLYVTASTYDSDADETTIEISPTPTKELGSRSANNPELMLITDRPVTGSFLIPFEEAFNLSNAPVFAPVSRGAKNITLFGNFLEYAIAGNVLEVGGDSFIIASASVSEDGNQTTIELTDIFQKGYTSADSLKISKTPIYQKDTPIVVGKGAYLTSNPYTAIRLNSEGIGEALRQDLDYTINPSTGDMAFDANHFSKFNSGDELFGVFSLIKAPSPYFRDGVLVSPLLGVSYIKVVSPVNNNGFTLKGKYEYDDPDGFYFRALPLKDFAKEVLDEDYEKNRNTFGSYIASAPDDSNNKGVSGILSTRTRIKNRERVARTFLSFYHNVVCSLEQMIETSEGIFIGDRDGKLKFNIRREDRVTETPGFEDLIDGSYTPRILFREAFSAVSNSPYIPISTDPLLRPHITPSLIDGVVLDDQDMTSSEIKRLTQDQKHYVENEVDDIVLVGTRKDTFKIDGDKEKKIRGVYKRLGETHKLSRLFPQRAKGYGQLYKGHVSEGLPEQGIFTAGRIVETGDGIFDIGWAETWGDVIGQLQNNVVGEFSSVTDATLRKRFPRARVVKYSPTGFPELDTALGLVGAERFATTPRPAVIATPLLVKDFPLDGDGLPNLTQLSANGGSLSDLSTGDIDLATPPFEVGETLNLGYASGQIATLRDTKYADIQDEPVYAYVKIRNVYSGCVIDFQSSESDPVRGLQDLSNLRDDLMLEGDTLFCEATQPDRDAGISPTIEEMELVSSFADTYRAGSDFTLRSNGEIVDRTLPSLRDTIPFPIKEMLGQTPPDPEMFYDADISFAYSEVEPLRLPALFSEDKSDSGDYSVPYLSSPSVEKVRLRGLQKTLRTVLDQDNLAVTQSQYPDEIIQRTSVPNDMGVLEFSNSLQPIADAGAYAPKSGVADAEPYDLMLSETLEGSTLGSRGILSVGALDSHNVEPPRYVSHAQLGNKITYELNNALAYEDPGHFSGVAIRRTFNATLSAYVYTFKIESIGGLDLTPFQDFWLNAEFATVVEIRLYKRDIDPFAAVDEGEVVDIIRLLKSSPSGSVTGSVNRLSADGTASAGFALLLGSFSFQNNLTIITPTAGAPLIDPSHYHHHVVSATDFYISNPNNSEGHLDFSINIRAKSRTANIEEDRLTFTEIYPLSHAGERGLTHSVSGVSLEATLEVEQVETGLTGNPDSSINSASEINGGDPLTFKRRTLDYLGVGIYDPDTSRWGLKAHGWEGFNNTPVKEILEAAGETLNVSVIPSSEPILEGEALAEDLTDSNSEFILKDLTIVSGALEDVEKSDVLKIKRSAVLGYPCTTKAGSYLIRGVVPADVGFDYGSFEQENPVVMDFPKFKYIRFAGGSYSITVQSPINDPLSYRYLFSPVGGKVHIFTDITKLYSGDADELRYAVICADYVSIENNDTFTSLSNFRDALGNPMSGSDFTSQLRYKIGVFVSGMTSLPINFEYTEGFTPQGYHDPLDTIYGVKQMVILTANGDSLDFSVGRVVDNTGGSFGTLAGELAVRPFTNVVVEDLRKKYSGPYFYNNTPSEFSLSQLTDAQWFTLNNPRGVVIVNPAESALKCLTPFDLFFSLYRATAGIYLEPTVPQSVQNLGDGVTQRVVDEQNPNNPVSPNLKLEMRALASYVPAAIPTEKEYVSIEVSHIRRFHEANNAIEVDASELSYIYEMRRANSLSFVANASNGLLTIFESTGGTQLGVFTEDKVNINAGDELRVKRRGVVVFQSKITKVEAERLYLELDWELDADHTHDEAVILLKQAPIPHQQSCEELLDAVTDTVKVSMNAESGFGGYTPWRTNYEDSANFLKDNNTDRDVSDPLYLNYVDKGVEEGDIVVIDPAEVLNDLGERGARPFGDLGVQGRTDSLGNPVYQAGSPSPFDDNRGFYKVVSVSPNELTVTTLTSVVGNSIFGDVIEDSDDNQRAFAVYPTINGSLLSDSGREGQMDLRPTEYIDPNTLSFGGNYLSIAPYSYKIIKPTGLLSENAIGQILLIRERTLSLIEQIRTLYTNKKYGSYRDFQEESHAQDVGSNIDPTIGLGVALNVLVEDVRGQVDIAPYVNDSDCLSVLDRRVFIEDLELDSDTPLGSATPYTLFDDDFNQPSMLTRIGELLNQGEDLLESRYSWLDYRVNRKDGSFQELLRYDYFELPRRQKEAINRAKRLAANLEE